MGKRSDYEKKPRDFYATPKEPVYPLKSLLPTGITFCEPCAGDGRLVFHLEEVVENSVCFLAMDIEPQAPFVIQGDANNLTDEALEYCQYIITNPPYTWSVLKPLMDKWISLRPTILLLPADFMHNKRFSPFLEKCRWISSIGRVKWIEGSKVAGVDNYAWYMFDNNKDGDQAPLFFGRT